MFEVGQIVGHYRVVSRLSEGGMASLLLGRNVNAPEEPPVAIKVIHEHLSADWQFVRMFIDEALISVRIRHPNVVRVDELGEQTNTYYLVMEYVHGCSLAQLLRAMGKQGRRMRPEIAVWIAQQVAAGLHAAHEMTGHDGAILGVIHRDISPQNVLLAVDGHVKLLDFGIAKARGRAERTEAGVIKGKVRYMAPEQAMGQDIDRRIDIYALGVVLWEMLTMRRYIDGKTDVDILRKVQQPDPIPPSLRVQGIDRRIDDAVMAALAPTATDRPATAAAFQGVLEEIVPPSAIGPVHVAELLRLFVADEIEAAAKMLPADVGRGIAQQVRDPKPLPGEDLKSDDHTRVATLTNRVPKVSLDEGSRAPSEAKRSEVSRSTGGSGGVSPPEGSQKRAASAEVPSIRPTVRGVPTRTPTGAVDPRPEEAGLDGPTITESGAAIDKYIAAARAEEARAEEAWAERAELPSGEEALAEPEPAAPPTRSWDERSAPEYRPEIPSTRSTTEQRGSFLGTIARVLLIVVVAFALGAGIAMAWVRFFAK